MRSKLVRVFFCTLLSMSVIGCGNMGSTANNEKEQAVETDEGVSLSKKNGELVKAYDAVTIKMSDEQILVDGNAVSTSDTDAVYAANDIVFYLEGQDFTYGEGTEEDEHSQSEADTHTVVHITQPGNYVVSGSLSKGQIAVDLGEDAKDDENAVVTLILNNADITCEVAPAVIFYDVYECGSDDEEDASKDVDTSKAGANVILADGSINNVNGSYVAKIYESVELNEDETEIIDSKKLHKYDAAFYSRRSMNINGEAENTGVLNIKAENEGLDSELHLTINGGNINITSGNDGINTNEDGISVTTINGGSVNIVVDGSTGEGDGIDSNGWLVINGGNVKTAACSFSMDAGIDSDMGIHINGGTVLATGNMLDAIAESEQNYVVFTFDDSQKAGSSYELKTADDSTVGTWNPVNDFSMLVFSGEELQAGTYTLYKDGEQLSVQAANGMMGGGHPQIPDAKLSGEDVAVPGGNPMMKPDGEWKDLDKMPERERPELPEGEMPEEDELPEIRKDKEGELKLFGGKMQDPHRNVQNGEIVTEFEITDGGNMFRVVTTVQSE